MRTILKSSDYFDHTEFPLAVVRMDPQPKFPIHQHQFFELLIITRGTAVHSIDGMHFSISAGDTFVLNNKCKHQFTELNDLALVNILFDPQILGMFHWDTSDLPGFRALFIIEPEYRIRYTFKSRLKLDKPYLNQAIDLIFLLENELKVKETGYKLAAQSIFMQLITFLSRCYGQSKKPQSQSLLRIVEAINFLDTNFRDKIDFDKLGEIAHMSPRNFQRIFKQSMDCSAHEYLINSRIKYAKKLLKSSNMTITDIAYDSGFNDSNYFTRVFKKQTGFSPKAYSKRI